MSIWWKSAADFWAMGGQGFFVWMSYGALLAAIVVEVVLLAAR
jgi:heme exporter protein CcmD